MRPLVLPFIAPLVGRGVGVFATTQGTPFDLAARHGFMAKYEVAGEDPFRFHDVNFDGPAGANDR